jgi:enterochelin esterase family protein
MKGLLGSLLGLLAVMRGFAADDYKVGPDSQPKPGVPEGKVEGPIVFKSTLFPGTIREYYIYVPAQYDPAKPACVMVFQDGHKYVNKKEEYRVPVVFDNLIHQKEMPVTIGVFVNPGHRGAEMPKDRWRANNRSVEYDTLSDLYARFVLDELLPEVGKKYNLTKDPDGRAICGASSGGICAFTVAWERPDAFRKVISHIGSFTNIRGGHVYPGLVKEKERKPIRVFLQDGSNDINRGENRNWPKANQEMAAVLKEKGYDVKFEFGDGGHTHKHGGALLPDSLRWLWRDYPK